jgi:hypothetical protein
MQVLIVNILDSPPNKRARYYDDSFGVWFISRVIDRISYDHVEYSSLFIQYYPVEELQLKVYPEGQSLLFSE